GEVRPTGSRSNKSDSGPRARLGALSRRSPTAAEPLTEPLGVDHPPDMTQEHLSAVLATAQAQAGKDGWSTLGEDRTLTLYVANQGVSLNIARIEAVRTEGALLFARNQR